MTTSRNPHTEFSLQTSDKLKKKFDELKTNSSLQILSDKNKLDGSTDDLEKKKNNSRQPSVKATLLLHTAVKKLTMDQLEECYLRYPLIKTTGRIAYATHVVTQIQYGATATFTFTDGETEENEQQVNWQFESKVQQFAEYLKGDPNVGRHCIDTSPENDKRIKFHFKRDFKLPDDVTPPTTYEGAIEFAEKIFRCASDWMDKDPLDKQSTSRCARYRFALPIGVDGKRQRCTNSSLPNFSRDGV